MKASFSPLLLCALLMLGSPALGEATSSPTVLTTPAAQAQTTNTLRTAKQANLRKLPDRKSDLVESLDKHALVSVLSTTGEGADTWAYVQVHKSERKGYMLASLLEPVPTPSPAPTATPTPSPTPEATATPQGTPQITASPTPSVRMQEGETLYDEPHQMRTLVRANLRKKPDGALITELKKNTQLYAIGEVEVDGELWLHIEKGSSNREGYILASLLRQVRPLELLSVTEDEVRIKYPVLSFDPIEDIKRQIPFTYTEEELAQYSTLRVDDRSQAVLNLRRRLYELGYYAKANENTLYTESTADVIAIFQRDCGVEPTGEADPLTQALLFDERMLAREGSTQEVKYLSNAAQPLYIQKSEVTSYSFFGSVQVSVKNQTNGKMTAFGLKIIPNMSDSSPADMADTFAEEIEREYTIDGLSVSKGNSYSDFATNDVFEEEGIWPHHFQVSRQIYFTGAQVAVCWYRSGGRNVFVDDDQMVFVPVGNGTTDILMHTLPISISDEERALAAQWEMGIVARYVLPIYQVHYGLPQGAWLKSVNDGSPAQDAGLQVGDIIVGIDDMTILGDATLRKARAAISAGESVPLTFWRDGAYYETELVRPKE